VRFFAVFKPWLTGCGLGPWHLGPKDRTRPDLRSLVAKLLQKLTINDKKLDNISEEGTEAGTETGTPLSYPSTPTCITATGPVSDSILPTSSHQSALDKAMKALSKSDLAYLIGSKPATPISSTNPFNASYTEPISLTPTHISTSSIIPKTQNEIILMAALQELKEENVKLREWVTVSQATNVLNEIYCNKLCFQLAYKEEKKDKKDQKGKLIGDGLPRMLIGDDFYEQVVEFTKWRKDQEQLKADRRDEAEGFKVKVDAWKEGEKLRIAANKACSEKYHTVVETWTKCKEGAKKRGKSAQFKEKRPKLTDFGTLLKAAPRP
jgi:hypothetical protein